MAGEREDQLELGHGRVLTHLAQTNETAIVAVTVTVVVVVVVVVVTLSLAATATVVVAEKFE